ncbi:MAG TPA: hypothetical protein VND22_03925 [Actinomycetota bacterium]|nr:hypothetical protein [Actinomycetota bacterium]
MKRRSISITIFSLAAVGSVLVAAMVAPSAGAAQVPSKPIFRPPLDSQEDWTEVSLARERVKHFQRNSTSFTAPDGKVVTSEQVRAFLESQGSPMATYATEIVLAGNRHGVSPSIIVAIAGVESTFGKYCAGFNAWGWDGGRHRWSSWQESIHDYARRLSTAYPSWSSVESNARAYNPNTPEAWGSKVNFFVAQLQKHPVVTPEAVIPMG